MIIFEKIPPIDLPEMLISLLAIRLATGSDMPEKMVGSSIIEKQNKN